MKIIESAAYRPCREDAIKFWPKVQVEPLIDGSRALPVLNAAYNGIRRMVIGRKHHNNDMEYQLDTWMYGVESFYCENGAMDYATAFSFALQHRFDTVVDIGCADGVQSELIAGTQVRYIGVEPSAGLFWRPFNFSYIRKKYPCEIPVYGKFLGISRLCTGYLMTDYLAIAKDFDDFLLDGPIEAALKLSRYYREVSVLHDSRNPHTNGWLWFHGSIQRNRKETEHA